ncbi:uncharacterized protein ARB_05388 [Trichophyton benhamiae CBS 112371]|uniref:Uncharacterized protein n=1 Tax=Arthroderma benhamiae (strain ATCC MYA-4681 / CBS 112371) TaxID=663331 RepID=D4AMD5_ARTBC|nr:uncharacterized protein ARB_05388 [Trichophyton benhamiae CBS 112371]EFE35346.1 hypothetical protein ARB_05388 [Trichophyton benhamiae CBS 112371]
MEMEMEMDGDGDMGEPAWGGYWMGFIAGSLDMSYIYGVYRQKVTRYDPCSLLLSPRLRKQTSFWDLTLTSYIQQHPQQHPPNSFESCSRGKEEEEEEEDDRRRNLPSTH